MQCFNNFMEIAVNYAKKKSCNCLKYQEIPIGCIIVNNKTNQVIVKTSNLTKKNNNPIAHAEIIAINKACKKLKISTLKNYDMYVTLEPCAMCAFAISLAKINNLYIGTLSEKTGAVISNINILNSRTVNHKVVVYYDILKSECKSMIKKFFEFKR